MGVLDRFLDAIKLNDDYEEDDFLDEDLEDDYDEDLEPKKSFFDRFRRSSTEEDDIDDEPPLKSSEKSEKANKKKAQRGSDAAAAADSSSKQSRSQRNSSKITPMRNANKKASMNMEVFVIKPSSMEDTREIADTLLDNCTVVLNLEGVDVELAQRIIDFTSGSCYSLDGSLQKISSYIFIITPSDVDISGDFQNILGDTVPSMRAGYQHI